MAGCRLYGVTRLQVLPPSQVVLRLQCCVRSRVPIVLESRNPANCGLQWCYLDSERGNFKLFGFIYWLYLREFELFGARLLKKRG